ncbi:MAG: beta-N-acetylhexosaminidase, partial [Lachnospiraceae bacterium]|nr:beta-N-acetylhexosaminidase [Lachnospiraceae bacterium]
GADFVMVSHVVAASLDEDMVPSSFSSVVVTDILRGELGFDGVVITDALDMGAITDNYASDEAAIKAIVAGVDMLLMPENFEEAYTGLLTAVQEGIISEERINESLRRIYRIKYANKLT